jgi:hypothetical protein
MGFVVCSCVNILKGRERRVTLVALCVSNFYVNMDMYMHLFAVT